MAKVKKEVRSPGLGVIDRNPDLMTVDRLKSLFPEKKRTINQQTVDIINNSINDPAFQANSFENSLVEFRNVMKRRSGSLIDYICALKYVAYLETGMKDLDAFRCAFSHKDIVKKAIGKPATSPEYTVVSASSTRYRKSPMVQDIMTLADVPMYLLLQTSRYKAVGVLEDEMTNAPLSKDRIAAATSILQNIKEPDNKKIELEIGLSDEANAQIRSTDEKLTMIAEQQLKMLEQGFSIEDVQQIHIKEPDIVDAEVEE